MLEDVIGQELLSALYEGHKALWDHLDGIPDCQLQQQLAGRVLMLNDGQVSSEIADQDYCESYDRLPPGPKEVVVRALDALSGQSSTTDDDDDDQEAPVLPSVGVGILALLLTARGVWLRRRLGSG